MKAKDYKYWKKRVKDLNQLGTAIKIMSKNTKDYTDDEIETIFSEYDKMYNEYLKAKYDANRDSSP
tara:strand:- start:293 stop:490 length:198 start_codon:yes stop_codon:yes gene_type:complete